jgi:hypothetical protein
MDPEPVAAVADVISAGDSPEHIVWSAAIVPASNADTVTTEVAVPTHPFTSVPVMV